MSAGNVLPVTVKYGTRSQVQPSEQGAHVALVTDSVRAGVGLRGVVQRPGLFRDALMTTLQILASDLRHKSKDRAAYLAYLLKKGKKATAAIWEAQKAFLDQSLAEDTQQISVLDPLVTIHPDETSFEVFSKDESSYARLSFSNEVFSEREALQGTSFADLSGSLLDQLDRMRTSGKVRVDLGTKPETKLDPGKPELSKPETREQKVPTSWVRSFLQVQSAATLPATVCEFAPIDLYNLLFALRTRKAKKPPRALRFELVPNAPPRMVVEPWEIVLEGHAGVYKGNTPKVVRTFGRQRLMFLGRILPYAKKIRLRLTGAGLPVFWIIEMDGATLTVALSGWTESGWAGIAAFDALTPSESAAELAKTIRAHLSAGGPSRIEDLAKVTNTQILELRSALQLECLRGRALFDVSREVYRPRDLLATPIDDKSIRYGNERESFAHRLLGAPGVTPEGEVKVTKLHDVVGEGTEIHGEVSDKAAQRTYATQFTIDLEGRTTGASCTCSHFRRAGMREGPCEHLIALRLFFARKRAEEEALRNTPEGRKTIRAETRTYVRRDESGAELVYRVSLDGKAVVVRWGNRTDPGRQQRLWFDSDKDARNAYFARLESLSADGYIDAESAAV